MLIRGGARNLNSKDQSSKELQNKNKFIYLGLTLIVLIFSITGATYAYFALTASNNTTITGTVGGATLSLTVTKSFPTSTTNMVPQLESTLDDAISTTYSCVDGNGNVVCQVYKAVIKNTGTTSAELTGTISFQNINTLPNLKWKQLTDERTIGSDTAHIALSSEQAFENKKLFAPNETTTYYFVVWIDEIGAAQTDRGTFRATINFKPASKAGITSTIAPLKLSEVEPGSYVAYTGNNGCTGTSCTGQNANYVDDTNMGYCHNSSYHFTVNGWRIGYIKDDTAYLVSAGSPECMCTNSDGTSSNSGCSNYETTNGVPQHLSNLNNAALKYCNPTYAYGGICNSTSSWNMNATDFQNITGSPLSSSSCHKQSESTACGYGNNLIDNGSYYWFATSYSSTSMGAFYWSPDNPRVINTYSSYLYGSRIVLRLASSVLVTGGSGTYEDPYEISIG